MEAEETQPVVEKNYTCWYGLEEASPTQLATWSTRLGILPIKEKLVTLFAPDGMNLGLFLESEAKELVTHLTGPNPEPSDYSFKSDHLNSYVLNHQGNPVARIGAAISPNGKMFLPNWKVLRHIAETLKINPQAG